MNNSEFVKRIKGLGFTVNESADQFIIKLDDHFNLDIIVTIISKYGYEINTDFDGYKDINDTRKRSLLAIVYEYFETAMENRFDDDEKRYYIIDKFYTRYVSGGKNRAYVNYLKNHKTFVLGGSFDTDNTIAIFSDDDIEKYDIPIDRFEKVELSFENTKKYLEHQEAGNVVVSRVVPVNTSYGFIDFIKSRDALFILLVCVILILIIIAVFLVTALI